MNRAAPAEHQEAAFGPLLPFARVRFCESRFAWRGRRYPQGAHAVAVSASLRLRCGARLGVAPQTHFAHFVRYVQTGAASQFWMRAARADSKAALLAATEIAPCGYHLPRCNGCGLRRKHHLRLAAPLRPLLTRLKARRSIRLGFSSQRTERLQRGRRHPAGAISGATSSAGPGSARASAHPYQTRRVCLNAANEVSEVSYAARPRTEQHSAVGAKRRPPQHEPPPGAACRAAPNVARIAAVQRSAMGRKRPFLGSRANRASWAAQRAAKQPT